VYVHAALLEQVLVNLLDNAGKHAPPASEIQVLVAPDSAQSVAISVVDSGPGIPEAEREKVFERFYRGGASDRDIHGSGLGLTICAGLVEAHQGHIEALPGPGGIGSRLRITLPVAPPGTRAPEHVA
jgi:two-component system sensor histidine kinase KdpD